MFFARQWRNFGIDARSSLFLIFQTKGEKMKIAINLNLVEFTPENEQEAKELNDVWRVVVDCVRANQKLVPVGEYVPGRSEFARFAIED